MRRPSIYDHPTFQRAHRRAAFEVRGLPAVLRGLSADPITAVAPAPAGATTVAMNATSCPPGYTYRPDSTPSAAAMRADLARRDAAQRKRYEKLLASFPKVAKPQPMGYPSVDYSARLGALALGLGEDPDPVKLLQGGLDMIRRSIPVAQKACSDLAFWTDSDTKARCQENVRQTQNGLNVMTQKYQKLTAGGRVPTKDEVIAFLDSCKVFADQRIAQETASLFNTANMLSTVAKDTGNDIATGAGKVVDAGGAAVGKVASTLVKNLAGPVLVLGGTAALIMWLLKKSGASVNYGPVRINGLRRRK